MKTPFIKVSENQRIIGMTKEGEKLIELGHIFNFQGFNDIAVIEVKSHDISGLVFYEVNDAITDIAQITDEKTHFLLQHLWNNADVVNKIHSYESSSKFLN